MFIFCPSCDEIAENYYGICLNCGDESEKEFAINKNNLPKWMPNSDLKNINLAIEIRKYLKEKNEMEDNEE